MNEIINIAEIFAENVFNDSAMRKYLPGDTYKMLKKTIDMVKREIIPAVMEYQTVLADGINKLSLAGIEPVVQKDLLSGMNESLFAMCDLSDKLEKSVRDGDAITGAKNKAYHFRNQVFASMEELRAVCDKCESIVPAHIWRLPTYSDIMYK